MQARLERGNALDELSTCRVDLATLAPLVPAKSSGGGKKSRLCGDTPSIGGLSCRRACYATPTVGCAAWWPRKGVVHSRLNDLADGCACRACHAVLCLRPRAAPTCTRQNRWPRQPYV